MLDIKLTHRKAMKIAHDAVVARQQADTDTAERLYTEAFALEREVALSLKDDLEVEPTRSVLLRSAASLALECGETREAERLVAVALSGDPPEEIAEELRELLDRVNSRRHKDAFGTTLTNVPVNAHRDEERQVHQLSGTLVIADSIKKQIKVMDDQGKKSDPIRVPKGMGDIVRSLWDEPVIIDCITIGGHLQLENIMPANG